MQIDFSRERQRIRRHSKKNGKTKTLIFLQFCTLETGVNHMIGRLRIEIAFIWNPHQFTKTFLGSIPYWLVDVVRSQIFLFFPSWKFYCSAHTSRGCRLKKVVPQKCRISSLFDLKCNSLDMLDNIYTRTAPTNWPREWLKNNIPIIYYFYDNEQQLQIIKMVTLTYPLQNSNF